MADLSIEKFNPTDNQLAELVEETKKVVVTDINDKAQLDLVKETRIKLRDFRVLITKTGKEMREDATKFSKAVIEKEKQLIAIIEPEESRLKSIEDEVKEQKIKADRMAVLPMRKAKILESDETVEISDEELLGMDDNQFVEKVNALVSAKNARIQAKLAQEQEELRKREEDLKREQELQERENGAREDERKRVLQEQEDKKKAWEDEQRSKLESRISKITALGLKLDFSTNAYILDDFCVPFLDIQTQDDIDFAEMYTGIKNEIQKRKDASNVVIPEEKKEEVQANVVAENKEDHGHMLLIEDIRELLHFAENYEYHDFKNKMFATPKVVLRSKLLDMAQAVVDGKYDN